jgi:site-specific DNA recombinase
VRTLIAIYARVSTEEQAKHGFSIAAQIRECRRLAGGAEALVFTDEGVSGETLARPALEELRKRIEAGEVQEVVCLDPDRLSRKLLHQLLLTEEWDRLGVRLVFVNGDYSRTPEGNLFYALRGAISEFEKAKINERMCRGRREKARQGRVLRDFQIYGYDFDPNTEQLVVNEEEAEVVRRIFKWFLQPPPGITGMAGIARALTEAQVPTKRGAAKWHRQVVRQILSNRTYLGEFYQNKWDTSGGRVRLRPQQEWILIPCPPIISPEMFTAVQLRLSVNSRS